MAQAAVERQCTLLLPFERAGTDEATELGGQLEKGTVEEKKETMKKIIKLMLNGESLPSLLMYVIRFGITSDDHNLKKLVYLYLEVVDKTDAQGKLLPEMILVCNMIRNDLVHANEFVRGCALRFLSKLKEYEVLEPLVASIRANLEHRHSYVRRNAVLALLNCVKVSEHLVLDAADLMENFLRDESDSSAKRNAFLMLVHCSQDRAVDFVLSSVDVIGSMQDIIQLVMLELVRKVCRAHPQEKAKYMHSMIGLLGSPSDSVTFECCGTLVSLSSNPAVVRAATQSYCQLLSHHSDNNVKLIVLDRLTDLKRNHTPILQECLMDIVRGLASPNVDIKRKILDLTMELVSPRNIDAVVGVLKKEVPKTQTDEVDKSTEYRQLLIQTIHTCVLRFPEVAGGVVHLLMDFVGDQNSSSAHDVIIFMREVVHTYPSLRKGIVRQLLDCFPQIRVSKVYRVSLWIFSEYCSDEDEIDSAIAVIRQSLGDLPFCPPSSDGDASADGAGGSGSGGSGGGSGAGGSGGGGGSSNRPAVLADGTYASQSAGDGGSGGTKAGDGAGGANAQPTLRSTIVGGDFFLSSVVASTLTKLAMRSAQLRGAHSEATNALVAEVMLYIVGMIRFGTSGAVAQGLDDIAHERMSAYLLMLADVGNGDIRTLMLDKPRESFGLMLAEQQRQELKASKAAAAAKGGDSSSSSSKGGKGGGGGGGNNENINSSSENNKDKKEGKQQQQQQHHHHSTAVRPLLHADDLLTIRQLRGRQTGGMVDMGDDDEDLSRATGAGEQEEDFTTRLKRVMQLTGLSDPVYAEAVVTVHLYDIVLDVLVINQTDETLQNVCLELATVGDLKLCERPQNYTLGKRESRQLRANIKVSSTETGIIYGNITFETASSGALPGQDNRNIVILTDIHIDIMDYITPATCGELQFRIMWAEFEWENKVVVTTSIKNPVEFLNHIVAVTNMRCLTPISDSTSECLFLAANLYAKSIFDEDALANISVEKQKDGSLVGSIRIRSKTQGIALSLGDKITLKQKGPE